MGKAHFHIEKLRIRNYKAFQNAELKKIPPLCLLVGKNGSGKSTLFDVLTFLQDALLTNVTKALSHRGGFAEVVTRGSTGPIEILVKFRESKSSSATYAIKIGQEGSRGIVLSEVLIRKSNGVSHSLLDFSHGTGSVIADEETPKQHDQPKYQQESLESSEILAIKGLGQFQSFRLASEVRKQIENWHVSDFNVADARPSAAGGESQHLSNRGENLSSVARNMMIHQPAAFREVLERMKERIPGLAAIEAEPTVDGRVVLKFHDGAFRDPFTSRHISDGTIKMFAYLLLLHDPAPFPLLAIEEPENQLYPRLLGELWEEFQLYAARGGQVLTTTHSPDLLNSANLDCIYVITKVDGAATIRKASESQQLTALINEGDKPGELWRQGLLTASL